MIRSSKQLLVLCLFIIVSTSLDAGNIYHCKNKFGGFVFSDKPCPIDVRQNDEEAHQVWKELKSLVMAGRTMTSNQQSNVDSILQCKSTEKKLNVRLNELKDRVDSVAERHENLLSVYDQITQCITCRASASYYCSRVDAKLDGALNQIKVH